MKIAVDKLVLKRSREGMGSQKSIKSSDSKGDSHRKGKKEYVDICGILATCDSVNEEHMDSVTEAL